MGASEVARELVRYGLELESLGAAQVGGSFSGDEPVDALIESEPNAFLLGVLFTQGIPAERAWSGPWLLQQRMRTLDPVFLASHPQLVREAVQTAPMLHRFKETLPRWIVSACERLVAQYEGDASRIWPSGAHVLEVIERLTEFDGIGRKKAVMATEILTRHFGVDLVGRECGSVAYDVHVRRVFLRSGLAAADTPAGMAEAAARWCPASPGTLDLPAWLIGRQTCRPKSPACERCRLGAVCPRLTHLTPVGVGARLLRGAKDQP